MEFGDRLQQINDEACAKFGYDFFFETSFVFDKVIDFEWLQGDIVTGDEKKKVKNPNSGIFWVRLEEFVIIPSLTSRAHLADKLPGSFHHGCDLIEIKRQMEIMKWL